MFIVYWQSARGEADAAEMQSTRGLLTSSVPSSALVPGDGRAVLPLTDVVNMIQKESLGSKYDWPLWIHEGMSSSCGDKFH